MLVVSMEQTKSLSHTGQRIGQKVGAYRNAVLALVFTGALTAAFEVARVVLLVTSHHDDSTFITLVNASLGLFLASSAAAGAVIIKAISGNDTSGKGPDTPGGNGPAGG